MRLALGILVFTVAAASGLGAEAAQGTRLVCGVREGTAGDAFLLGPDGRQLIELARQGGPQTLLRQADWKLRGQGGTQVGAHYCLSVAVDRAGQPTQILWGQRTPATPNARTNRHR